jgi:protein-tyrosine-phosphatase
VRILFICSGNICRSPMAEEYARHRASRTGLSHLLVESAGTLGIEGAPASDEAVETLRKIGLDLTQHRSRGLRRDHLDRSEMILVMERRHLEELDKRFPVRERDIYLLRAFEDGPDPAWDAPDLDDPIGLSQDVYQARFEEIRTAVDYLMIHLRNKK